MNDKEDFVFAFKVWRDVYLVIVSCLFGAVFYLQTNVNFLTEKMFQRRVMLYIALVAYGVIPSVHWVYLNGGLGSEIVNVSTYTLFYAIAVTPLRLV